ncbi:MAG TPA: pilus assembly protein PilC, partial [Gammaproteobacteria bacterium]|nr:pilus assembly protein PilC [Gammaproteobacteria bacterium]
MSRPRRLRNRRLLAVTTVLLLAFPGARGADVAQSPLYLTQSVTPLVLLSLSVDHQLFKKAYSDFSDIDDDGQVETTYDDSYDYYGYFYSTKCYDYDSGNGRFEPNGNSPAGGNGHTCAGAQWSGNFLNWATMTRIDIVRKVFYGGKRAVDAGDTVLERALLPTDVHAFAKVFSSADMQDYTPYTDATLSFCNTTLASGDSQDVDTSANPPLVRVAAGS